MIQLKTNKQIDIMKEGGVILMKVVSELDKIVAPGVTTNELDARAESLLKSYGAEASFKTVPRYKWATCTPVNAQAVHTPPSSYQLLDGDILTIDIGALYKGFHTDYAKTYLVGQSNDDKKKHFLKVGQETLESAIKKISNDVYLGTIAECIEHEIEKNGYFILKELTGHGIGKTLHEDPYVLNYLDRPVNKTYRIQNGLAIAIEIIYSMGSEHIAYEKGNKWSIVTEDMSMSACFERTIAIVDGNTHILT